MPENDVVNRYEIAAKYPGKYGIVGVSPQIAEVFGLITSYNPVQGDANNEPVLITGATGTGKNLVAMAIHVQSGRAGKFASVNCAAIPTELLESALFGHYKGAFTDAVRNKDGWFEVAKHGTIHLDEIGTLHPSLQAKILRAIENHEIERIGGTKSLYVDARVVASTNTDLESAIARGMFRDDLYHRINVFPIHMPSLDERREDIPLLARFFYEVYAIKHEKPFSPENGHALKALANYNWPGNVRQLEHVVERILIQDGFSGDITRFLDASQTTSQNSGVYPGASSSTQGQKDYGAGNAQPSTRMGLDLKALSRRAVMDAEREFIAKALEKTKWNRTKATKLLGISYRALLYKIKDYGLTPSVSDGAYKPHGDTIIDAPPHVDSTQIKSSPEDEFKARERAAMIIALNEAGWNAAKAARKSGIRESTFYYKMDTYRIQRPSK